MSVESLLVAERPEPRPEFAAELDTRVANGFAKAHAPKQRAFRLRYALGAASVVVVTAVAVASSEVLKDDAPRDLPTVIPTSGGGKALSGQQSSDDAEALLEKPSGTQAEDVIGVGQAKRQVARTADLVLSTAPEGVPEVADGIVDVTHRYRGFVVSSNVSSGNGESANGEFELKLPARTLQPALDDLSDLGHVSSLTEGTDDITSRFKTGHERITELTEQRERLRAKLADAGTIDERRSIRFRLHEVRRALETVRADLSEATERVRFVPVHVGIRADAAEVDTGWSIGDALDDAVRVLEVAVGVTLIALAGSVPVAIVVALLWLAARAWMRSRRERALDEQPG